MRSVHLIGIGGMHMSAIARLLLAEGARVTGSDLRETDLTRRLAALGATVYRGHAAAHVGDVDLVVVTAAAKPDNPEVVEARRRGLPVLSRAEMVARLMEGRTGIAVAGTHGKTTTATLIAWLLERAGRSPTYLLGGESVDLGGNAAAGSGPNIVVEADEYARAFLEYRPRFAVLTNIEPDHLEYYGSLPALVDAFRAFLHRVPADGRIVACADDPTVAALLEERPPAAIERYRVAAPGTPPSPDADWLAVDEGPNPYGGHSFTLLQRGELFGRFESTRPGRHNVANAAAALAVGAALGLAADEMAAALRDFHGARRRFEVVGEAGGVTVIDDYAVHPTEIAVTLASGRERFPGRRLVVLFQPHTYSRTAYLLDGFRGCFAAADALYVLETYAARETPEAGMSAAALAGEIRTPRARYLPSLEAAIGTLVAALAAGDVLITMGAGDVTHVGPRLLAALAEDETNDG
jgi:UDP-N-acetylmuramate--alanine ligase